MTGIEGTGYNQFNKQPGGFKPSWIVIHHSSGTDGFTRNWDAIRRYHMSYRSNGEIISKDEYDKLKTQGAKGLELPWRDIGYNLGIENINGKITVCEGRKIGEIGAHALGFNDKSIGVCVVGNYDIVAPDDSRLYVLEDLCRNAQLEFGIPRAQVIGHRETYGRLNPPQPVAKSCPGKLFDLDKFRARLRD